MPDFPLEPDTLKREGTRTCRVCGAAADAQCDDCQCWLCFAHLIIEEQAWDGCGWDGVDFRCPEHRWVRWETRDLLRGRYLPLPNSTVSHVLTCAKSLSIGVLCAFYVDKRFTEGA